MTPRELLQELVDAHDRDELGRLVKAWRAARAYLSAVPQTEPREATYGIVREMTPAEKAALQEAMESQPLGRLEAAPQERANRRHGATVVHRGAGLCGKRGSCVLVDCVIHRVKAVLRGIAREDVGVPRRGLTTS